MIVMDIKVNNFFAFKNFHMNMTYPKKIIDSSIENEFLKERTNFRYKKVNILMGANATGKTSFGKLLMAIFNFMDKKQFEKITDSISDTSKEANFSLDFVLPDYMLYRITTNIAAKADEYKSSDIDVSVKKIEINKKDSYESCVSRLEQLPDDKKTNYIEELEKIKGLSWLFNYPSDSNENHKLLIPDYSERYLKILEHTLKALDPSIIRVEKIDNVDNAYVIRMQNQSLIIQDGKIMDNNILSSGTRAGVEVAGVLMSMLEGTYGFYYCDEKFSYIHSDIEKAFLAVMIQKMKNDEQLFFTTHNTDILDLPLPKHSFMFLKKDIDDSEQPIKVISASQYLKRNTDSIRNAVDNDLFSVSPNVNLIYEIADL